MWTGGGRCGIVEAMIINKHKILVVIAVLAMGLVSSKLMASKWSFSANLFAPCYYEPYDCCEVVEVYEPCRVYETYEYCSPRESRRRQIQRIVRERRRRGIDRGSVCYETRRPARTTCRTTTRRVYRNDSCRPSYEREEVCWAN